jgi:glycerophosphoryl diester phosphodiesterase
MVDLLVDELDALGAIDSNIFHTLDHASLVRLKELRPDAMVGYILAFAGVDIPDTPADFVVIEQFTATQEMQDAAAAKGLAFFTWTVNDEEGIRELLRRGTDGMITDHPDIALDARTEMQEEQGLAGVLVDALTRFVLVF